LVITSLADFAGDWSSPSARRSKGDLGSFQLGGCSRRNSHRRVYRLRVGINDLDCGLLLAVLNVSVSLCCRAAWVWVERARPIRRGRSGCRIYGRVRHSPTEVLPWQEPTPGLQDRHGLAAGTPCPWPIRPRGCYLPGPKRSTLLACRGYLDAILTKVVGGLLKVHYSMIVGGPPSGARKSHSSAIEAVVFQRW